MDDISALLERIAPRADLLVYSALILGAGILLAALADSGTRRLVQYVQRLNFRVSLEASLALTRTVRFLVFAVAIVVMLNFWGLGLSGIWTGMLGLIAGIGVALIATWAMLSNITGSLFLSIWRPYHLGDELEILPEAVKGRAIDRNLMFTVLKQEDGAIVSIPNNLIFQRVVRCYPAPAESWMDAEDSPVPAAVPDRPATSNDRGASYEALPDARPPAETS
jgi:small-conductance mechanosensitive channel